MELSNETQTAELAKIHASLFSQHPRDVMKGMVCLTIQSDESREVQPNEIWSHEAILCQDSRYFKGRNISSSVSRLTFSVGI